MNKSQLLNKQREEKRGAPETGQVWAAQVEELTAENTTQQSNMGRGMLDILYKKLLTATEIEYVYSRAAIIQVNHLGNLLSEAVQSSSQRDSEHGEPDTNCVTLMLPRDPKHDISINLLVGQKAGFRIIDTLKLQPLW